MVCVVKLRLLVVNVAMSVAAPLSVPVPMELVPSLNVTVPVGLPATWGVTVAVNVTVRLKTDGLADADTVVVVLAVPTVCRKVADGALVLKFVSPPYTAVMVSVPAGNCAAVVE